MSWFPIQSNGESWNVYGVGSGHDMATYTLEE